MSTNFEPPGKPGKPDVKQLTSDTVDLAWKKRQSGSDAVLAYKVLYRPSKDSEELEITTKGSTVHIKGLSPETEYQFQVQAVSAPGVSVKSDITTAITPRRVLQPADAIIEHSTLIDDGDLRVYQLPLSLVHEDQENSLYKYDVGTSVQMVNPKPEKVLLMVGATGAGKSELVNGIANFVLKVNWKDNVRFKVVSNEAYSFHFSHMPFVLTVIDTPGFGSTEGIKKDKKHCWSNNFL